jgi:hypothetical protein
MLPITSNDDAAVPAGTSVPVNDPQICRSVRRYANLVGEPDAANPHVRFDEREVETEHGGILGHRQTKGPATRKATTKPPRHSSTLLFGNLAQGSVAHPPLISHDHIPASPYIGSKGVTWI